VQPSAFDSGTAAYYLPRMRKISVVIALLALGACGGKKDQDAGKQGGAAGSGAQGGAAKPAEQPVSCPPGNVVADGACVAAITPEQVAAVTQQQSRIDEAVKLLERVDTLAAPIDLMNGIRQIDQWKTFAATNEKAKKLDEHVASLGTAVEQLRVFKAGLGEASGRLGNLKDELDRLLKDTGTAKRIEEARALVSSQVRTAVQPLAQQVTDTIQKGLAPLTTRFDDATNVVTAGCALMALGRAGDKSRELCGQAAGLFAQGRKYLDEVKTRPATLFDEVTTKLETELAVLIDDQTRQALDAAQTTVNDALKLPAGGGASGAGGGAPAAP
jgi:hypothetical protein